MKRIPMWPRLLRGGLRAIRPTLALSVSAALLALAGCAAQSAWREGETLMAQGRRAEAVAKFEEAARLEPGSAQYRASYLGSRRAMLDEILARGAQLQQDGRLDDAEQVYRTALGLPGADQRALDGLRRVERQRRWDTWLAEAKAAHGRKDHDGARTRLKALLLEEPAHAGALVFQALLERETPVVSPEAVLAPAYRKPVTIEFKDAPLKNIFDVLSRTSGINFLFDKDVKTDQKASIFLRNATVESAIQLTLLTQQLEQRVIDGNTVLIYPNNQAKQKEYQPLSVRSYYLTNAEAKSVSNTLKTILKSRDIVVDDKLNLLIVRDTPEALRLADKLVQLHDVAEPEVMLEVEILEVKRTRLLDLGVRWPDQLSLSPLAATSGGAVTLSDLRHLNGSRIGATVGATTLSANQSDTEANLLANPRIRTRNREKAKILIGERVPNITPTATSTGFVSESVNYVEVGLRLEVEPTIYADSEVAIKISLEVSNIINQVQTKSGALAYQIGTRTAQTVLRLRDGENQILAGLINDEDRRTANKLPGLGDVPIAGRLFGRQADDRTKTEIILSITPRVVRNTVRPDARILEFDSGTEASLGRGGTSGSSPAASGTSPVRATDATPPGRGVAAAGGTNGSSGGTGGSGLGGYNGAGNTGTLGGTTGATTGGGTPGSVAAANAQLRWQAPSELRVGDTFSAQVLMQADQPVVSVPMAIAFDPKSLQVVSVIEGDFLRQDGGQTTFNSRVDPAGQVLLTGTRAGDTGARALAGLVTLNMKVIAAPNADTRLQVLTVAPIALGGRGVSTPLPPPQLIRLQPP